MDVEAEDDRRTPFQVASERQLGEITTSLPGCRALKSGMSKHRVKASDPIHTVGAYNCHIFLSSVCYIMRHITDSVDVA